MSDGFTGQERELLTGYLTRMCHNLEKMLPEAESEE